MPAQHVTGGFVLIRALQRLCLGMAAACGAVAALAQEPGIESTYAQHTHAVELARAGRYDDGLAVLYPLLDRFPNNYPLLRDAVLINTWKSDCEQALRFFARIREHPRLDDYLLQPVADCAVRVARAGDTRLALEVLDALRAHAQDDYALRRDMALITQWKGDCPGALARFAAISADERNPPYLIAPMADCLLRADRRIDALALIDAGLARYPDDPVLLHARTKTQVALRLDGNQYDERALLQAGVESANSDRDLREWLVLVEASARVAEPWRIYARYLASRTDEAQFDSGEMNRIGAGARWRPNARLLIDQGFSTDVEQSDRDGSHTRVTYYFGDRWRSAVGHDTYADDISVRARANDIEARRSYAELEYNSLDHVWYWYGIASGYRYTDTNRRSAYFTTVGYTYAILPVREHRIYLEWYGSHNTLANAAYFNPSRDRNVAVVHSTEFVFDSRYKRHVDRLNLSLGAYRQDGFGQEAVWGIGYEQQYDFDGANALSLGAAFNRNFYDGAREDEWRVSVVYTRRF